MSTPSYDGDDCPPLPAFGVLDDEVPGLVFSNASIAVRENTSMSTAQDRCRNLTYGDAGGGGRVCPPGCAWNPCNSTGGQAPPPDCLQSGGGARGLA
eukprot:COSAG01_NODE_28389_length_662_cov_0.971581_2_plen_96_part_01